MDRKDKQFLVSGVRQVPVSNPLINLGLKVLVLYVLWAAPVALVNAQDLFISRYVPGNYLADNEHLVELFNPTLKPVDLEGYFLVCRNYSVRLPSGFIQPGSAFRIGKRLDGENNLNLELSDCQDFLIRFPVLEFEGNYIVLYHPEGRISDAFYFSPIPNVPYLPDRDTSITFDRKKIPYFLPPENRPIWSWIQAGEAEGLEFEQRDGAWQVTSTDFSSASTAYRNLTLRFSDGSVQIKWNTLFEQGCDFHLVERSTDQEKFLEVGKVKAAGNAREIRQYLFYEDSLETGGVYYYRIHHRASDGRDVYSRIGEVRTDPGEAEFQMEVYAQGMSREKELNIRFVSRYAQRVRIRLMDAEMRELSILFDDYIFPQERELLKLKALKPGRYYVIADTETRRFGKEIVIQP